MNKIIAIFVTESQLDPSADDATLGLRDYIIFGKKIMTNRNGGIGAILTRK